MSGRAGKCLGLLWCVPLTTIGMAIWAASRRWVRPNWQKPLTAVVRTAAAEDPARRPCGAATIAGGADEGTGEGLPVSAPPGYCLTVLGLEAKGPDGEADRLAVETMLTAAMHKTVRRMTVTAYCPCRKCCGKWARVPIGRRRTACGERLMDLMLAGTMFCAAREDIPFGTGISIPGYNRGYSVPVLDRGGSIVGDRLDVFIGCHEAAEAWGSRELDVTIWGVWDPAAISAGAAGETTTE